MATTIHLFRLKGLIYIILIMIVPFILLSCASKKETPKEATVDVKAPAEDNKSKTKEKEPTAKPDEKGNQTREHIVQQGETLSIIAKKYNVTVDAVVKLNNIADANFILVGQKLLIPGPGEGEKK